MTDTRTKLEAERLPIDWRMLRAHHQRGALFLVGQGTDLLEVAVAVAEDRSEDVARWLESGALARPTDAEAAAFEEEKGEAFEFLIVQPFVLAQRTE